MDLLPSDEQFEIITAASAFLAKEMPIGAIRTRRHEPSPLDAAVWKRCASLGWFGIGLAEAHGGVGYGAAEEALLFREIGRHLAPGPLLATSLAVRVAARAGQGDLAAALLSGEAMSALALPRRADAALGARIDADVQLIDRAGAGYILVTTPAGAALVAAADVEGCVDVDCIDPGVRLATASLRDATPVALVTAEDEDIFSRGALLSSAMLAGMAEAVRDMAAEYAKVRVQFGKPIGVHQAIKHRCAEMALRAEAATSQLLFAALSLDAGRSDTPFQVAAAKVVAANAAIDNAADNIQLHGGIGYTFEYDANLFLKRAHVVAEQFGSVRAQLDRLMALPPAQ